VISVEMDVADRGVGNAVRRRRQPLQPAIAAQEGSVIDLLQIMIFGGQPEHGHAVDTQLGSPRCQTNRSRGFENGKQRATKQAHLLPCNHTCGSGAQAGNIF
jgi:hypothetical protein